MRNKNYIVYIYIYIYIDTDVYMDVNITWYAIVNIMILNTNSRWPFKYAYDDRNV